MNALNNKIILITGASSGIGQACARSFAAQGAKLILSARRVERLQQELEAQYGTACFLLPLDVRHRDEVQNQRAPGMARSAKPAHKLSNETEMGIPYQ